MQDIEAAVLVMDDMVAVSTVPAVDLSDEDKSRMVEISIKTDRRQMVRDVDG